MEQTQTSFQITGVDPYIVCEKLNLDAQKYPYVTLDYKTNDLSNQAQLYYMTDVSPIYSREKCLTFNLSHSYDRHIYKLDMSQHPSWNSLITSLRLDPVHYPSTYQEKHITSECTIYGISVSQSPFAYNSKEDYAGNQRVNQWEYDYIVAGESKPLAYDPITEMWGEAGGTHIGLDFQKAINGIGVSRNWIAPSDGTYKIVVSGECDADTEMSVIVDGITVFQNDAENLVYFEESIQLHIGSIIQIATRKGEFKKIDINFKKL